MPDETLAPRACEIADYTRTLLATGGYNGFSYADISAHVQIGKASIHHHFPSKAELVRTVVARYRAEASAGMAALNRNLDDPKARLEAYTDYWSQCIRDGTAPLCICAMLAAELPSIPPEVADEVRGHFRDLVAWIAAVLARGADRQVFHLQDSPAVEAQTFMATVHGAMLGARAFGDPVAFDAIARAAIARLMPAS